MRSKKESHTKLSNVCCRDCNKPLKVNAVVKGITDFCYVCFNLRKGKKFLTYRRKKAESIFSSEVTKRIDLVRKQQEQIKTYNE